MRGDGIIEDPRAWSCLFPLPDRYKALSNMHQVRIYYVSAFGVKFTLMMPALSHDCFGGALSHQGRGLETLKQPSQG